MLAQITSPPSTRKRQGNISQNKSVLHGSIRKWRSVFIVGYYQLFIMQSKFYPPQPNCCSPSSLFKFTIPRPPSHSLLVLNRLRSSRWHHNSLTRLCRGYCSLPFITAPGLSTFCCSHEESNILSWMRLKFLITSLNSPSLWLCQLRLTLTHFPITAFTQTTRHQRDAPKIKRRPRS